MGIEESHLYDCSRCLLVLGEIYVARAKRTAIRATNNLCAEVSLYVHFALTKTT